MRPLFCTLLAAAALVGASCLGDAPRRPVGESCASDDECREGLVCADGICRGACAFDRDCPEGEACIEVDEGSGVRACARIDCNDDPDGCPPHLVCSERLGMCLDPCTEWRDCGAGRLCVDGACVEPAADLECGADPAWGEATTCEPIVAELAAELTLRLDARTVPAVSASGEDLGYEICPIEYENGEDSAIRVVDGGTSLSYCEVRNEALEAWVDGPSLVVFFDLNAAECEQPDDCTSLYSAGVLVRRVNARPGCPLAIDPALDLDDLNFIDTGVGTCFAGLNHELLGQGDDPMPPQIAPSVAAIKEEILAALQP